MAMNRIIMYGIEKETGIVASRVGSEVAYPVLQWDDMTPANNFEATYALEKMSVYALDYPAYKWTKKIPVELKNRHREFWGMKPLPVTSAA